MSIVLTHIIIAVISLIITGATVFKPTHGRLVSSAISIVLTIGSGVWIAVIDHAMIVHVCESGLTYLAIEVAAVGVALRRRAVAVRQEL